MSLGTRIIELRKKLGLTQANLAKAVALSPSTIAMYETNRRTPDETVLAHLARVLEVPETYLADGQGFAAPPAASAAATRPAKAPSTVILRAATHSPESPSVEIPAPVAATVESDITRSVEPRANPADNSAVSAGNAATFALSREEARIILFMRMNPRSAAFLEQYISASAKVRDQFERTLQLIHQFSGPDHFA